MRAERREARLAWGLILPAAGVVVLVALFPLAWTVWESLHLHDLRMPWRGQPFIGMGHFLEIASDVRFRAAMLHTAVFTVGSVVPELVLGMAFALVLNRTFRGRAAVRALVIVPWALPTVVAALLWRFMFDGDAGIANVVLVRAGMIEQPLAWFVDATAAWVPVILADVWKATPFVALLLLAGLQSIDPALYEAARIDGAGPWRRFVHVTLPALAPAILVALIFRSLDAFRVFDLIYVLTAGGPGTATEPVALYTFAALLQNLRFGYGSALSVVVFAVSLGLAATYVRLLRIRFTEVES